jgi:hypothetical protein
LGGSWAWVSSINILKNYILKNHILKNHEVSMFLLHQPTEALVEILNLSDLFNPFDHEVLGRSHAGEELQDPVVFLKSEMTFPSGESLPACWQDSHYREHINVGAPKMALSSV